MEIGSRANMIKLNDGGRLTTKTASNWTALPDMETSNRTLVTESDSMFLHRDRIPRVYVKYELMPSIPLPRYILPLGSGQGDSHGKAPRPEDKVSGPAIKLWVRQRGDIRRVDSDTYRVSMDSGRAGVRAATS